MRDRPGRARRHAITCRRNTSRSVSKNPLPFIRCSGVRIGCTAYVVNPNHLTHAYRSDTLKPCSDDAWTWIHGVAMLILAAKTESRRRTPLLSSISPHFAAQSATATTGSQYSANTTRQAHFECHALNLFHFPNRLTHLI